MGILQVKNEETFIEYGRGDDFGTQITVTDKNNNVVNISGFSFILTVDSELSPVDEQTMLFKVNGLITDSVNGKVIFFPTSTDTDLPEDVYFYDIEMIDGANKKRTVLKSRFSIVQDITK